MSDAVRDAQGRFVSAEALDEPYVPGPHVLSAGQLAVLRDLPEVCGVAGPGEVLEGVTCAEHHYLVQFWPLLGLGYGVYSMPWVLGTSLLFDIDTMSKRDKPGKDGRQASGRAHFAEPVLCVTPNAPRNYHQYIYDHNYGGGVRDGSLCRGEASFSNDPFACALLLRLWLVQTLSTGQQGPGRESGTWWKANGDAFLLCYPKAKCVVVPTVKGTSAEVIAIRSEWVEAMKAGTNAGTLVLQAERVVA